VKCCDIKLGMLRTPVEIQRQQTVDLGGGATEITYSAIHTTMGYMKPISGNERLYAERVDAQTKNRLVIRYRADLTESDRLVMRGRAYNIRALINLEFRDRWWEIHLDGGVAT
jgi:SPP1 family predicted phage head-tail adaptor